MKNIKKNISLIIILILMLLSVNIPKVEAASASFSASASEVTVGTTVTLTASVNAGAWNLKITGNGVNQALVGQTDAIGNKSASTSASFTPSEAGTYTFNLTGDITDFDTEVTSNISKSITIKVNPKQNTSSGSSSETKTETPNKSNVPTETTQNKKTETTKSSNNYLSGITLSTGTLSPEFYRETYEYSVEFGEDVNLYELSEIEVSAQVEDSRASVEGIGKITLNEGENTISLNVTAENGSVRTYTIKVNKPAKVEQSELRLNTLVLNGINTNGEYQTIDFSLDPETFEYNLTVPNNISSISITPTTENEDIIIETNGGENLNEGSNKIVIILTSPSDETVKTTYTLNIEREAALEEVAGLTKEQIGLIIIGGIVVFVILIIAIVLIVKHRKKKKNFGYDEDEDSDVNFINNEEDSEDEEIEDPYPEKIKIRESEDIDKEETENDEKKSNTVDDVKPSKLKWDDFCESYEEDEEEVKQKKKSKHGKRFM